MKFYTKLPGIPAARDDGLMSSGCSAAWPTVSHRLKMPPDQALASFLTGCTGIRGSTLDGMGSFGAAAGVG